MTRHGDRPDTPAEEPAPTITSKARSDVLVVDRRTVSRGPGGGRVPTAVVPMDRPAPTLVQAEKWVLTRPATTIVGSFRPDVVAAPGFRSANDGPRQNAEGSIKITERDALILQSFDPDYPVQGSRSKRFQQIGNAVPPRLGAHVLAVVLAARFGGDPK